MKKVLIFLPVLFLIFQNCAMSHRVLIKKRHKRDQAQHFVPATGGWRKMLGMATCCAMLFSAQATTPVQQGPDIAPAKTFSKLDQFEWEFAFYGMPTVYTADERQRSYMWGLISETLGKPGDEITCEFIDNPKHGFERVCWDEHGHVELKKT
jgi:hypothetical protein